MKKIIFFIFSFLLVGFIGNSQCTHTSSFGSATINTSGAVTTISTCSFGGEYSTISGAVAGQSLRFTSSVSSDFITIRSGSPSGPLLAFGQTPLTFTNTFTGTIYAHWSTTSTCGVSSSCRTTTVQCLSCSTATAQCFDGTINAPGSVSGNTCGAGDQASLRAGQDLIYKVIISTPGCYNFSLCGSSTPWDSYIYLTSLCPGSGGTPGGGSILASNDDSCGLVSKISGISLSAGTYYLTVEGFGSSNCGAFILDVTQGTSPDSAGVITGNATPSCDTTTTYSVTPVSGVTYTWSVVGGTITSGQGTSSVSILWGLGPNAGPITVVPSNACGTGLPSTFNLTGNVCLNPIFCFDGTIDAPGSVSGNTCGAGDQASLRTGEDLIYKVIIPTAGYYNFSLCGSSPVWDSVIYLTSVCPGRGGTPGGGTIVAQNDDGCAAIGLSVINNVSLSAGEYYLTVEGFSSTDCGAFTLNITNGSQAPVITCPPNIVVSNDANQCGANVTYQPATATGTSPTITYSQNSGTSFPVGVTTVTATATDNAGSTSCTFTVTVNDTEAPSITCPLNIVVNNDLNQCGANVSFAAIASDNCGTPNITYNPASGSFFNLGTTTVTATADDGHGNTTSCTFTVTVNDTEGPSITCAPTVVINNTLGLCTGTTSLQNPIFSDNCALPTSEVLDNSQTNINNTWNTNGYYVGQSFTANANGNLTKIILNANQPGTGTIEIRQGADVCGPVLFSGQANFSSGWNDYVISGVNVVSGSVYTINVLSSNGTVLNIYYQDPGAHPGGRLYWAYCGNSVDYLALAFQTFITPNYLSNNAPAVFPVGNTTVIWTATDAHGNTSTCNQTVTVNDTEAPVITCSANIVVSNTPGQCGANVSFTASATDNCGTTNITYNPASGSFFNLGTTLVTATADDGHGNTASCTFTVTVNDTEAPTITCPGAVTVTANSPGCSYTGSIGVATATDCSSVTVSGPVPAGPYPVGTTVVTWTATDGNGISSTCTQSVTVLNSAPTVTAANVSGCEGSPIALSGTPTGGTWSVANPYTGPSTTYTYTYTDGNGCQNTSAAANITAYALPTPVITASGPTTFCNGDSVTLTASLPANNTPYFNSPSAGGTPVDCKCPAGYVAVGYTGYTGSWMDKIQLACKKLNPNGTLDPAVVYTSALGIGGGGGPNGPYLLTGDKVLVGGRADNGCCGYLSSFEGYGQSVSYIQANGNNSSSPTSAGVFGPSGYSLGTQFVPNGNVVVGIKGWLNGYVSGISLLYAPIGQVVDANFSWSNGSTNNEITVTTSGNYSVTATNALGCSATSTQTVTVNPKPVAISPTTVAICVGSSTTLRVSGASGYIWSPATGLNQTTGDTVIASPAVTTVYTVTATDPGSCSITITVVVNPLPNPIINVTGPTTFCQGGSATLTAVQSNPNVWSTGSLTVVKTFAGQTDNITPNTHLTRGNNQPIYNAITEAGPSGGCSWTPGNTEWAFGNIANWNTLSYQNLWSLIGCYPPGMVNQPMVVHLISENIYFQLTFTYWQAGGGNYTYVRTTQPADYTNYSWSNGQTTPSISATTSGNYTVTVTDTNGCSATTAATSITVDPTSVGGNVTGTTTICTDFAAGQLSLSGQVGNVVRWESATAPFTTWNPIANTGTTYAPGILTETTKYRAIVLSGTCSEAVSSVATVTVNQYYTFYADNDNDGYGGTAVQLCSSSPTVVPPGYYLTNTDCNDSRAAINPGAVEISFDNIDNDCDGSLYNSHPAYYTNWKRDVCGKDDLEIDKKIECEDFRLGNYVVDFRFRITNLSTGEVNIIDSANRDFRLTETDIYMYGTWFKIEVALIIGGEVQPYNPVPCQIKTKDVKTSEVYHKQCGRTLALLNTNIKLKKVGNTNLYRIRVAIAGTPNVFYYLERTTPNFDLTMAFTPALPVMYNTEYLVDVQVRVEFRHRRRNQDELFVWSQFGDVCSVITPALPETQITLDQCTFLDSNVVPSNTYVINAIAFPGVTTYRFRLTDPITLTAFIIDRAVPNFTLAMVPGLLPNTYYDVEVDMLLFGSWVGYGKACTLLTPAVLKASPASVGAVFKATAYPNPFANNFMIDVKSSSQSTVNLKVYDMLGRLVEQRDLSVSDLETTTIGERYPSGVYNVVVSQADSLETVRIVKR